jgi:hypothetical protein
MSYMALEAGNTKICRDIFQRGTQLYVSDEDETEINESRRSKAVSQTHTICNLGVYLSAECQKISAVCSNIFWMSL